MSWYPDVKDTELPWSIIYYPTEPLLAPTRRVISPVGCVRTEAAGRWLLAVRSLALTFSARPDGTSLLHSPCARLCTCSGVDVSPVVWFALLSFLNEILLGRQGLLVLLSEKTPVV